MNPGTICTLAASTCAALECLAAQVPAREKDFPRVISRAREVFSRAGTDLGWSETQLARRSAAAATRSSVAVKATRTCSASP